MTDLPAAQRFGFLLVPNFSLIALSSAVDPLRLANMALGRRVLASNTKVNVFHRGFKACDDYANGETAISHITCPVLFLLGAQDQMTLAKSAQLLIDTAERTGKNFSVVSLAVGHHQMTEAPEETLMAIKDFLK